MNQVVNTALEVAKELDPTAPSIQIAEAAVNTIAAPSAANILADAELAISLIKQLRDSLAGTHPSIGKLVKSLLKGIDLMRKKMEWEWEKLDEVSRRVKVIGGWIVQAEAMTPNQCAISAIFIPDGDHEWTIIKPSQPDIKAPTVNARDFEPI